MTAHLPSTPPHDPLAAKIHGAGERPHPHPRGFDRASADCEGDQSNRENEISASHCSTSCPSRSRIDHQCPTHDCFSFTTGGGMIGGLASGLPLCASARCRIRANTARLKKCIRPSTTSTRPILVLRNS